jgi:Tol biopolymer transport system component
LAVSRHDADNTDIYIITLSSTGIPEAEYNVTRSANADESNPAWSHDGQSLSYVYARGGAWWIYVMRLALFQSYRAPLISSDRAISPITRTLRVQSSPAWAPGDEAVAYASDAGTRVEILVTDLPRTGHRVLPGTNVRQAARNVVANTTDVAWSPDGTQIAFAATFDKGWDIFIYDNQKDELSRLTSDPAPDWQPAWSPDGMWIAFTSLRSGNSDIFLIRADGTGLARLTSSPGVDSFPVWWSPTFDIEGWLGTGP